MRTWYYYPVAILAWFFVVGVLPAHAEVIREFDAEYTVLESGVVEVTEVITYDFAEAKRSGIYRIIETDHPQDASVWYKTRSVDVTFDSATRDGETVPLAVDESRGAVEIRIGDPEVKISGAHRYEISYRLDGVLSHGPDGAEFYWNVTGDGWEVPMETVTARVREARPGILAEESACYQGDGGSEAACANIDRADGSVSFTATDLAPGEQLTVATAVNPDAVTLQSIERIAYLPFGVVFGVLWFGLLGWWVYRFRTRERVQGAVIAQYEPYGEYLPMYTGMLFTSRLDPRDITAGIIYLAEQGFIKITRTEQTVLLFFTNDDYELTLQRPIAEMPTRFLRDLAGLMFTPGATLPQQVALSEIKARSTQNRRIIKSLQKDLKQDLVEHGYATSGLRQPTLLEGVMLLAVLAGAVGFLFVPDGTVISIGVAVGTIVLLGIAASTRRTRKGYEALHHLQGFKEFLRVTDKERFTFHNAPKRNPETFMQYLPYAIALGVEKEWAEAFADMTIPEPEWYDGGGAHTFSATALTSNLGTFSSSFNSSSGTSGSSGGGSAGGGAGGGGGGSF